MADVQNLESLLRQGVELSHAKRFREAEPILLQVLTLEPRHTGAAYLLSLCLYFTGQFRPALQLFGQLTAANSPLEPEQQERLAELSRYARYESLRIDYWEGLKTVDPDAVGKEVKKRKREADSLESFHLHLAAGKGEEWLAKHNPQAGMVDARILDRSGRVVLLPGFSDVDEAIGPHLEIIGEREYGFIPLPALSAVEFGPMKQIGRAHV